MSLQCYKCSCKIRQGFTWDGKTRQCSRCEQGAQVSIHVQIKTLGKDTKEDHRREALERQG